MKRFVFRLERLLNWRRRRKEAQSTVVARALEQLSAERHRLDTLSGQHRVMQDGLRRTRAGLIDPQQQLRTEAHDAWLRDRIDRQNLRVADADEKLSAERATLSALALDEKLIGKLRERRAEEHRIETLRMETQEMDEIGKLVSNKQLSVNSEE